MNRSAVPPPVTQVMDAAAVVAAGADGPGRGAAGSAGRGPRARRWRTTPGRRSRPAASGCARCWSCSAPARAPPTARCGPRRRSSWSTWRRWSTTTCSTRPRSGAGCRRSSRPPGATARWRSATCCSRARSPSSGESNTGGAERRVRLLARASVGLALGELAQRRDAFDLGSREERYRERAAS